MKNELSEWEITRRLQQSYCSDVIDGRDGNADWQEIGTLHCAAVLIPLARYKDEWHIILTRRSDTVETHSGQVSFPGGGCDLGETSPEATALREAEEEIGVKPEHVRLMGRMNDMITISRYRVTPVVGIMPWPYPVRPAPGEVARVFTIPLHWLADRKNWRESAFTPEGSKRSFPVVIYNSYDGETLWGISGRMMVNFVDVLGI